MIYGHSKAPADLMQSYTLHKQGAIADGISGVAQARQAYYLDRAPLLEDVDRSNTPRQKYEGAAIVLKIYANSDIASAFPSAGEIIGADIKVFHADADASGEAPGTFSEFDLAGEFGGADCIQLNDCVVGDHLEMRGTVEAENTGTGYLGTVLCNLDISRMKRFIQVELTPQLAGSAAADVEMVVEGIVAGSSLYRSEKDQGIEI